MKQMKLSVGVSDFEKIRSDGYYYIDKSGWIKGLLKSGAEVTLLTRPRRFGKTLGMSMLANFFDITKEEREAGPTNFIMGLAFITEGAIPYAAADPLHVIPACIIGSGAAGAVSMFFKCTLMAPHGGIFVFPVVGNAIYYVIALVAGTIISTICLGLFKKKAA